MASTRWPENSECNIRGGVYHVIKGGDRREAIFIDDGDRQIFLDTLGEACQKADWQVHAWCLMHNHFHLVLETPPPSEGVPEPSRMAACGPAPG